MTGESRTTNFRRWLVGKVARSRWPIGKADTDETVARRLGVQPDVLAEARLVLAREARMADDGRTRRLGMPRAADGKRPRYHVFLEPPSEIYTEWCAYRDRRGLTNAVLLRSLCHHVLQLKWQPRGLYSGRSAWQFRGRQLGQTNIRQHPYRMMTYVSESLYRALDLRGQNTESSPSAIARWAVTSLLEGKIPTLRIVPALDSLYKDPNQYCLTPRLVG